MTVYVYPDIRPSSQVWRMESNTAIFRSPLNNSISTQDRDGEAWLVQIAYADIEGDRRADLLAFLFRLNGSQHRFRMHDFSYARRGAGGGTPLVNGAGQTGKSLVVDGGPASQTDWLKAGDQIEVGSLLHSVDADVNTDGGGNATILVSPRIFIAPNNNDAVEIDKPRNSFALNVNTIQVSTRSPTISQIAFSGVSAL
jgi:hypothetical protein